jgi:hypothetical protein
METIGEEDYGEDPGEGGQLVTFNPVGVRSVPF